MGFVVVTVADVCGRDKKLKRVVVLDIKRTTLDFLLKLFHPFLAMAIIMINKIDKSIPVHGLNIGRVSMVNMGHDSKSKSHN